jgi:hypothetical protein
MLSASEQPQPGSESASPDARSSAAARIPSTLGAAGATSGPHPGHKRPDRSGQYSHYRAGIGPGHLRTPSSAAGCRHPPGLSDTEEVTTPANRPSDRRKTGSLPCPGDLAPISGCGGPECRGVDDRMGPVPTWGCAGAAPHRKIKDSAGQRRSAHRAGQYSFSSVRPAWPMTLIVSRTEKVTGTGRRPSAETPFRSL